MTNTKGYRAISSFFDSALFQALLLISACVITFFSKVEEYGGQMTYHNHWIFYGEGFFIIVIILQLLFCRHISATVLPFCLVTTMPLKCYDSFDYFIRLAPLAAPFLLALALRIFWLYRAPVRKSRTLVSCIPVAIAITCGGLGTLPFFDYIAVSYYLFGLGIGMVVLALLFENQYQTDLQNPDYDMASDYERAMCFTAILSVFMVLHHYYEYLLPLREQYSWLTIFRSHFTLDRWMQWRNNISTMLMITMPFLFSRAHKNTFSFCLYFPFANLAYLALLLSNSRGGIIFGTAEYILCLFLFLLQERRRVIKIFLFLSLGALLAFAIWQYQRILKYAQELFSRVFDLFENENLEGETRFSMISRTWDNFKRNPLFGSGLGYKGDIDVYNPVKGALYFYHSAPLQIVGSLGILGIFAYLYQLWIQAKILFYAKNRFACTVALSILFLWGMSMVNPGIFAPVPYAMLIPLALTVVEKTTVHPHL